MQALQARSSIELSEIINNCEFDFDLRICATRELIERNELPNSAAEEKMDEFFELWDYRLFSLLSGIDHILGIIGQEAKANGVRMGYSRLYMQNKLADMVDQIADNRKIEKKKKNKV